MMNLDPKSNRTLRYALRAVGGDREVFARDYMAMTAAQLDAKYELKTHDIRILKAYWNIPNKRQGASPAAPAPQAFDEALVERLADAIAAKVLAGLKAGLSRNGNLPLPIDEIEYAKQHTSPGATTPRPAPAEDAGEPQP